jgi:hypothetical protein
LGANEKEKKAHPTDFELFEILFHVFFLCSLFLTSEWHKFESSIVALVVLPMMALFPTVLMHRSTTLRIVLPLVHPLIAAALALSSPVTAAKQDWWIGTGGCGWIA